MFSITSNSFNDGDFMPDEQVLNAHGCTGGNISPDLRWAGFPDGTKEFALIVHDPDAPLDGGFYHWIVLNIPLSKTSFSKGEKILPPMVEARTSFSDIKGYGGACPPRGHGVHHYNFTIYALDRALNPDIQKLNPVEIEKTVAVNSLSSAKITMVYERK